MGASLSKSMTGVKKSDQHRANMSKGRMGMRLSEGHRKNISLGLLGNKSHLGTHWSEETRAKMNEYWKAHPFPPRGPANWNWNPDRASLLRNKRNDPEYKQWVYEVKKRDGWKCRFENENCEGIKIAHHILPWRDFVEERYNKNNGITLCQFHHPKKRDDERRLIPELQALIGSNNY
jgi:hypothetical protein